MQNLIAQQIQWISNRKEQIFGSSISQMMTNVLFTDLESHQQLKGHIMIQSFFMQDDDFVFYVPFNIIKSYWDNSS